MSESQAPPALSIDEIDPKVVKTIKAPGFEMTFRDNKDIAEGEKKDAAKGCPLFSFQSLIPPGGR